MPYLNANLCWQFDFHPLTASLDFELDFYTVPDFNKDRSKNLLT